MCEECGCGDKTALVCPECGGRMVLIDGRPACMSCRASTAEAGPHAHGEHQHPHADLLPRPGPDDLTRLRVLLPHWLEHNQEHLHDLQAWAAKARGLGLEAAAASIDRAIACMAAGNQALAEAMEALAR